MRDALQWLSVALPAVISGLRDSSARLEAVAGDDTKSAGAPFKALLVCALELADSALALTSVVMLSSAWLSVAGAEQFQSSRDRLRAFAKAPLTWLLTHIATHVPQLSGLWSCVSKRPCSTMWVSASRRETELW